MAYFIYARDGVGLVVLRRDSEEAARKRAAELKDMGWFDIDIAEQDGGSEPPVLKTADAPDLTAHG